MVAWLERGRLLVADHPRHLVLLAMVVGLATARADLAVVLAGAVAAAGLGFYGVGGSPGLPLAAAVAVVAGAGGGQARLAATGDSFWAGRAGEVVEGRAALLESPRIGSWGAARARVRLLRGGAAGRAVLVRLPASARASESRWRTGAIIALRGRVTALESWEAHHAANGIPVALELTAVRMTTAERPGLAGVIDDVRDRARDGLQVGLPPAEAALLRGMVIGEDDAVPDPVEEDFRRSGLAHILAVSGQNVMLLGALVFALGMVLGLPLRTRLWVAAAAIALYVPLTGAGPSIQRAGVMGLAGLAAWLIGRPSSRWYAIGLAAAITLAYNPRAIEQPGWQLSFAAVIALLIAAQPCAALLCRAGIPRLAADATAITATATLGTAPLLAHHFDELSLVSLPANLAAAPAIAPVMWLGMLAAAVAQVDVSLAAPLTAVNGRLVAYVEWVAHVAAAPQAAVVEVSLASWSGVALAYLGIAVTIFGVGVLARRFGLLSPEAPGVPVEYDVPDELEGPGRIGSAGETDPDAPVKGRPRHPGRPGRAPLGLIHGSSARVAVAATVLLVVAATATATLIARHAGPAGLAPPAPGELRLSFLDVGQGDATLVQTDAVTMLVDTGVRDGPILDELRDAGVKSLDVLLITHAEADHEGAALEVARHYRPRLVLNGGARWPTAVQRGLPAVVRQGGGRLVDANADQRLRLDGLDLALMWPPTLTAGQTPSGNPNDRAVVSHLRYGAFDALLPADAESNVLARLELPDVDALKVSHHGSDDPGLPAVLERSTPAIAAIEVGEGNSYGHPTPSTLSALKVVPQVFRSDRDGTVRLSITARGVRREAS